MPSRIHGELTGPVAAGLVDMVRSQSSLCVYHDHAGQPRQRLWAYYGTEAHRWNTLSAVDILVGNTLTREAALIIEIEETAASPKKLLGDVFSVALADRVATRDGDYGITANTRMWVCFPINSRGHQRRRNTELKRMIEQLVPSDVLPEIDFLMTNHRD